jgi:hypothetical protein
MKWRIMRKILYLKLTPLVKKALPIRKYMIIIQIEKK